MNSFKLKVLFSAVIMFVLCGEVSAKLFSSKYAQFELPSGWECALEGSEYVCQSENAERKKESIIILAAKIRGEQDSLDEYMAYLKKSKEYSLPGGKKQISEPKNTTMTKINGHDWVDALHLASEVPGFYTRYLATVKEDLGVAVTFSVTKDLYTTYLPIIDKLIQTLRVFRQQKAGLESLRTGKVEDPNFADTTFNPNAAMDLQASKTQKRGVGESGDNDMMMIIGVIVIAAVILVISKGKKKPKSKK